MIMFLDLRINAKIGLVLDDTLFDQWLRSDRKEEPPALGFFPYLRDQKHKVTMQDIEDFNAKIDEIWAKYPQFGRYDKPDVKKPQDLLGEDHALIHL